MKMDRRESFKLIGAGAAVAALGAWGIPHHARGAEEAASDAQALQGAGFYRFKVGNIEAALVSDGTFPFPATYPLFGANTTAEAVNGAFEHAFIPPKNVTAHVNVLMLRTGKDVVLVDAGCGNLFGPTTGQCPAHLERLGVRPRDVTAVIITHAHGDHVGGLLDAQGKPVYPNARYFAHKDEIAFWTAPNVDLSHSGVPEEMKKGFVATAVRVFEALKDKIEPFEYSKRIVEGVETVAAPGHTPGHTALHVGSGDGQLLYVTDAAHHAAINLPHPDWHVAFDTDPVVAARSRRAIFDRAASDRVLVSGSHLPFPAVGHVRPAGEGFEWTPKVWEWTE